jgi:hypothetical protein
MRLKMLVTPMSKGIVRFSEFPPGAVHLLKRAESEEDFERLIHAFSLRDFHQGNLVFNYPREQYARLDRGEEPGEINARFLTLSGDAYTDPAVETVENEVSRIQRTTRAVDVTNRRASIIRFIIKEGQFVGDWDTAILIGGPGATADVGTGKIIAVVNDVRDDQGAPFSRDGSTAHLISWKIKHIDSGEV